MPSAVFRQSLGGGNLPPAISKFPVAATQTLVVGDVVVLTSGQVAKAGNGTGRVLGVMAQISTTASAGTLVDVYVAQPNQLWQMTASADATSHVLAARTYDLNSAQAVNVADTTGGCLQIKSLLATTTSVLVAFTATEF